jgi:hypothetical protein
MRCIEFLRLFFRNTEFWNWNSNFSIFQQRNSKKIPTRIFGIKNGIGILLPMGVPEIGTKNWNSQPRSKLLKPVHLPNPNCIQRRTPFHSLYYSWQKSYVANCPHPIVLTHSLDRTSGLCIVPVHHCYPR